MKHRAIMAIALLALVLLTITPVSAWTEKGSTTPVTDLVHLSNFDGWFYVADYQEFLTTTRVTTLGDNERFTVHDWNLGTDYTLSDYPVEIWFEDTTLVGNGTLSVHWDVVANDSWIFETTTELIINDITGVWTGPQYLRLRDLPFFTGVSNDNKAYYKAADEINKTENIWNFFYVTGDDVESVAGNLLYTVYSGLPPAVVTSFTCTPTSQYPNTDVVCTDTSTNNPDTWLWSIDLEALGIDGWQTYAGQDFTWQSPYPGWYSVNLWANNTGGGEWENKTNYVFISANATPNNCELPIATGYSRTFFRCADTNTDASISGCNIQLNDIEGGFWSNVTDRDDGIWCIDTLPLHNINAYGQATGYTNGSRIGVQEWNMMRYIIPMIPGYLPPAANGSVWVYVHVTDFSGSVSLSGATVSLSGLGLPTQVKSTDSSGIAIFQWPNVTTAYINAAKTGYTTGMRVIETSDFGPDFVTIALHQGTYTSTITPTPTISGAPTAGPTIDPRTDSEKDTDMMNQVRDAGPILISLAILATLFGLVKLIGKK